MRGRVLDDSTGAAIAQVSLALLDSVGAVVGSAITDNGGMFIVAAPDSGRYQLRADRLGYRSVLTESFVIGPRDTVGVLIRMGVGAVPLAPLTVVGQRSRAWMRGRDQFVAREALGKGVFITPQQIAAMHPRRSTDVLEHVPGIWLEHKGFKVIPESKAWGCMEIIVNGLPFHNFNGEGLNGDVLPGDLKAMEVYRTASEIPPRLLHWIGMTQCGLIVVWTKGGW